MIKFGKLAPKLHSKTLLLSKYLSSSVPAPPDKVYREYKISSDLWGMFANDTIGDCTCAAIAHMLMLVTAHTGTMVVPTVDDVVGAYTAVSGYDPASHNNDNGAAITDVLDYWRTKGIAGHKILAWAAINSQDIDAVKKAIWIFGAVDIGIQLTRLAMNQFWNKQPWSLDPSKNDGGFVGSHSVPNFGYGQEGTNCITWAQRQGMNWGWFLQYCDEAYVVITQDWIDQVTQKTVSGFDLATLQADMAALSM